MTEQEKIILIETEQRSKSNSHRIDNMETELRDVKNDQKAIYKIATSVEVIAQRMTNIEEKVDNLGSKVESQAKAWRDAELKLEEKVTEAEVRPLKEVSKNVNSVKVAIITAVCTLLATGLVGALVQFSR